MGPGNILQDFNPPLRVITAVFPFMVAMAARMVWGKSRTMSWIITAATVWFVINVLAAPFSAELRQELLTLTARWR